MHAFRPAVVGRALPRAGACPRRLVTHTLSQHPRTLSTVSPTPWFVDPEEAARLQRHAPPHLPASAPTLPPLPAAAPPAIRALHAQLAQSPLLEPDALLVREPIPQPPGPPLPYAPPKGRRRRGGTYFGEGFLEPGGIWSWVVLAQVKEGTEKRGAIDSVVRIVRKTLLHLEPPLGLPKNSRKDITDGWAMLDAGDFAVHVLSKDARTKFFGDRNTW
ncbi:hypothetical protein FA95DRAFT_1557890 [Auriscalpium vulgare]|uniref:Uncharacterized protein n=1 Tax=Auriscalpium vulgare TaxID=40419 RepID=A0ACB8RYC3_9AGAM|nr:hypothetical protein FA95DRAFT_1557890 [Auriscalpium vulgare]